MPTSLSKYLDPTGLNETVVNIRQLTEALEEAMQDLPYARPGGLYPDMTVGAVIGADETAQWATRESTGSGSAIVRSVQGAAVAFNQMVINGNFESASYWAGRESAIVIADGVATIMPTSDGTARGLLQTYSAQEQMARSGHKYYIAVTCKPSAATNLRLSCSGAAELVISDLTAGVWTRCAGFWTPTQDTQGRFYALASATLTTTDTLQFKDAILVNLTQMFGVGNEPQSVAEFETMYPEAYYPYSAPTLKPVQIAGIASTDAQGGELDSVEWTAQELWAVGDTRDELTDDAFMHRIGVVDLGELTWTRTESPAASGRYRFASVESIDSGTTVNVRCVKYAIDPSHGPVGDNTVDKAMNVFSGKIYIRDDAYSTATEFKTNNAGVLLAYILTTPTTTPISPALPMTYKVQAGGSESVIVPDGEVNAAPVLTIAEPVNAGDEFARIWAAIKQLQSRGTAQLSRVDAVSIDEVQKDTADAMEIETSKEVQE